MNLVIAVVLGVILLIRVGSDKAVSVEYDRRADAESPRHARHQAVVKNSKQHYEDIFPMKPIMILFVTKYVQHLRESSMTICGRDC